MEMEKVANFFLPDPDKCSLYVRLCVREKERENRLENHFSPFDMRVCVYGLFFSRPQKQADHIN